MSLYTILLFVHVSSAICLFIGFSIWLLGITRIARAVRVEQVRTLADRTHEPALRLALHTITTMLFGIIFLMTTKPAFTSAIGAMVVSALLGLASGVPLVRARRTTPSDHFPQHEEDPS